MPLSWIFGLLRYVEALFRRTRITFSAFQKLLIKTIRITLPFKDQKSANSVKQQLCKLSSRLINIKIQPVFLSRKIQEDLKVTE